MADSTKDIWNDPDDEELSGGKKKGRMRRLFILLATLAAVFGVVAFAAYRDGTGFDVLRRFLHYGTAENAGGESVYQYEADTSNCFAAVGEKLLVVSGTKIQLLDQEGGEAWSTEISMESPAIAQGGDRVAVYDVGGLEIYVLDEEGQVGHLEADREEPFLAVTVNRQGMLAVTAEKKNHKGCVSVYDAQMQKLFDFNSSRRFITDAYVSDDGKYLSAVTLGQEEGIFVSNIVVYDLTKTDPEADYDISDGLVMAIGEVEDRIMCVTDTSLTSASSNGELQGTYWYNDAYLREYTLEGENFAALLLNRYKAGNLGRIVTVDSKGEEIASLEVQEEVRGISACGRYLAVLYPDTLVVYNRDLQVYSSLHGIEQVRDIVLRSDGSVLLLSSDSAELYLP